MVDVKWYAQGGMGSHEKWPIIEHDSSTEKAAAAVLSSVMNRHHVVGAWVNHQESGGGTGSTIVILWGSKMHSDGSRHLLGWFDFSQ